MTTTLIIILILLVAVIAVEEFRLFRAKAKLRASTMTKTSFLATVSHEIRTPLNAVMGFSELLSRTGLSSDEIKEYAEGITSSSEALLSLINDVLELAKLESEQVSVFDGEFDPSLLFEDIKSMFAFRCAEKNLSLSCIASNIPRLNLNVSCVRQILFNLVGNAVKYTYTGDISCKASIVDEGESKATFIIAVRDTGCGIPKNKLGKIFDPFAQAADARRDKVYRGTGLGLPIVKRLVDAAGGSIEVQSEVGHGTSFVIRIPNVKVTGEKKPVADIHAAYEAHCRANDLTRLSVVIVDDVPLNLKVLFLHLRNLGIADVRATDAASEAITLMHEKMPDVVLTDMWMPDMSGEQFATTIKNDPAFKGVKIVAVTADTYAAETFDINLFDGVLAKPVVAEALRDTLVQLFNPVKA